MDKRETIFINSGVKSRERKVLEGQVSGLLYILRLFMAKQNGELLRDSTCAKIAQVSLDGKNGKKPL